MIQQIRLDCGKHYEIRARGGSLVLFEYPEECPGMGEREDYSPHEGSPVATWSRGERVEFLWGVTVGAPEETEGVMCGDDFRYHIDTNRRGW